MTGTLPPLPDEEPSEQSTHGITYPRAILLVSIVVVAVAVGVWAATIYQKTIVEWWVAPLFGLALSVIFMRPMLKLWRRVTSVSLRWVLVMVQVASFTAIGAAAMLASNFYASEQASEQKAKVVVESRHKIKNYRTRRVGRRMVSTGNPYYTYRLSMRFPSGVVKKPNVPMDAYMNVRSGDTITVTTRHGWLDWPVYDPPEKLPRRHKKTKRHRPPATRGDKPIPKVY